MTFIWVARGRSWGFQFLRRGGFPDPLLIYEAVFDQLDLGNEGYQRVGMRGALRLADPEGRSDRAGRPIAHDFVLLDDTASRVRSVGDGLRELWPQVRDEYARIWELPRPPE